MIVFGPLWFVVIVLVVYWIAKASRNRRTYYCTACRTPTAQYSPFCPGCGTKLIWNVDQPIQKPLPSGKTFLKSFRIAVMVIVVFFFGLIVLIGLTTSSPAPTHQLVNRDDAQDARPINEPDRKTTKMKRQGDPRQKKLASAN